MRSSPKITLILKYPEDPQTPQDSRESQNLQNPQNQFQSSSQSEPLETTWACPICYFSNTLPQDFKLQASSLPPCSMCGISPDRSVIEQSIDLIKLSNNQYDCSKTVQTQSQTPSSSPGNMDLITTQKKKEEGFSCPRCTFINHPSLLNCEICGARLISNRLPPTLDLNQTSKSFLKTSSPNFNDDDDETFIKLPSNYKKLSKLEESTFKLSFRTGGDKAFYESLQKLLKNRKTIISNNINSKVNGNNSSSSSSSKISSNFNNEDDELKKNYNTSTIVSGIHGLELVGERKRIQNQQVLGSSLDDLQSLMNRAKDVIKLAESFANLVAKQQEQQQLNSNSSDTSNNGLSTLKSTASALGIINYASHNLTTSVITKDISSSDEIYYSELAREISTFLTKSNTNTNNNSKSILSQQGGIITLIDLYAIYNRARGINLISPTELYHSCLELNKLNLPIKLKKYSSGVYVIQESYQTDLVIIKNIKIFLKKLANQQQEQQFNGNGNGDGNSIPFESNVEFGSGATALEISNHFKWSIGVTMEELDMGVEMGKLCIDEQLSGTKYYQNFILSN